MNENQMLKELKESIRMEAIEGKIWGIGKREISGALESKVPSMCGMTPEILTDLSSKAKSITELNAYTELINKYEEICDASKLDMNLSQIAYEGINIVRNNIKTKMGELQ